MPELIKPKGFIEAKIKYKTGKIKILKFPNQVLNSGRTFLARCLLENPGKPQIFITNMLFGDGGTAEGHPKEIPPTQDKLFGVTRLKKTVVAQIDPEFPTQVIFSITISENEGNDVTLNEMALELSDETLFSISTFADLNKTNEMEIDWSWVVSFI